MHSLNFLSFTAAIMLASFTQGSWWTSLELRAVTKGWDINSRLRESNVSNQTFAYFDCGSMMLSLALTVLMVAAGLNQLCFLCCMAWSSSLLRCFHCFNMKPLMMLWGEKISSLLFCFFSGEGLKPVDSSTRHRFLTVTKQKHTHFCSCFPRPKLCLFNGWKTSTEGTGQGKKKQLIRSHSTDVKSVT